MKLVQAVKKLNSISGTRLNFRRRPILCTTLYRNPIQVSNFGGTFDQHFLRIFYAIFTQGAPLLFLYHGAKKSKMTKNSNQGGPRKARKFRFLEDNGKRKRFYSTVSAGLYVTPGTSVTCAYQQKFCWKEKLRNHRKPRNFNSRADASK